MGSKAYVNGSMLKEFVGQTVSVIGKIVNLEKNMMQMTIQLADGKSAKVQLEEQLDEALEGFVQMTVRVNRDTSLSCEKLISFGPGEIDLEVYNGALEIMRRHQNLFSSGEIDGMVH